MVVLSIKPLETVGPMINRCIVPAIAFTMGGWLIFDGIRALATGMYTVFATGAHAAELGPWSQLLRYIGINPLSVHVKWAHILLGLAWVLGGIGFIALQARACWFLVATAIASLWYLCGFNTPCS